MFRRSIIYGIAESSQLCWEAFGRPSNSQGVLGTVEMA